VTLRLQHEVAVAGLATATLVVDLALPHATEGLVLGGVVACAIVPWTWPRTADEKLRSRIATTAFAAMAGFGAVLFASAPFGAAAVIAALAAVAAAVAVVAARRLRGAPLPAQGEATGRATFEGTVHALGEPQRVPGNNLEVVAWVARQGRQRWASTARFEVRSAERRVALDPGQARIAGPPWVMSRALGRAAAKALDGANPARLVRVWSLREGNRAYVIGDAALADDPSAPTLRDPARISVFAGDALIGPDTLARARSAARTRVVLAAWVAIAGAAVAVTDRLGVLG
jgi:hypothetical protein